MGRVYDEGFGVIALCRAGGREVTHFVGGEFNPFDPTLWDVEYARSFGLEAPRKPSLGAARLGDRFLWYQPKERVERFFNGRHSRDVFIVKNWRPPSPTDSGFLTPVIAVDYFVKAARAEEIEYSDLPEIEYS